MNMLVLICGSRDWENKDIIQSALDELGEGDVVIAGGARGADRLGEQLAKAQGLQVRVFPADWDQYGKSAGAIRNIQMLDQEPNQIWAFWDGKSPGTAHTIREAKKRNFLVRIWAPDGTEETTLF